MKTMLVCVLLASMFIFLSVSCQENTSEYWVEKGWALNNVESYAEAIVCFDKAISSNSSSVEAWHGKGYALNGIGYETDGNEKYIEARGYYEEAIKCFERAISLNSTYIEAYMDMADSENRLDHYDKALEWIDKATKIDRNNAEVINVKGTIFYRMGKYDEAIESFREASKINPQLPEAWLNICKTLKEQKRGDPNAAAEAEDACQKAADIDNSYAEH